MGKRVFSIKQENTRSLSETKHVVHKYFEELSFYLDSIDLKRVFNMSKTPVYIDMMQTRTISFKIKKNTEATSSGHEKTRLTVVLGISIDGTFLRSMVILRGLKKMPRLKIHANLYITTSKSGTIYAQRMKE